MWSTIHVWHWRNVHIFIPFHFHIFRIALDFLILTNIYSILRVHQKNSESVPIFSNYEATYSCMTLKERAYFHSFPFSYFQNCFGLSDFDKHLLNSESAPKKFWECTNFFKIRSYIFSFRSIFIFCLMHSSRLSGFDKHILNSFRYRVWT